MHTVVQMELVLTVFKVTPIAASVPITAPSVPRVICKKFETDFVNRRGGSMIDFDFVILRKALV